MMGRRVACRLIPLFSGMFALILVCNATKVCAQTEWIERMDDDRNGYIEPDEISDRARDFLERAGRPYGIRFDRPVPVRDLERAAKRYFAERERGSRDRDVEDTPPIPGFSTSDERPLIPGFGLANPQFPYTRDDLDRADRVLRRYDEDQDGSLNRREINNSYLEDDNPLVSDENRDGKLNQGELAQFFARRRIFERRAELQATLEVNNTARDANIDDERDRQFRYSRAGRSSNGDRGSSSLAQSILQRYDFNRNDLLEPNELDSVGFGMTQVDYSRDGKIDQDELARFLNSQLESKASESQELIPTWFFERDVDGDNQVVMSEFTEDWSAEDLDQFGSYDLNSDGIITTQEVLSAATVVGGQYSNNQAQVLLPRSTIVSEIEVTEDYLIGDLNVQLSITHTFTSYLDGYLTGPDGQRIELFSGVGGSDDNFDKTVFDDDVGNNITRAQPPFSGTFQPEALVKRERGLNHYRGKSIQGVWQLMIRASRSDRSGVLHGWSLLVKPDRTSVDDGPTPTSNNAPAATAVPQEAR